MNLYARTLRRLRGPRFWSTPVATSTALLFMACGGRTAGNPSGRSEAEAGGPSDTPTPALPVPVPTASEPVDPEPPDAGSEMPNPSTPEQRAAEEVREAGFERGINRCRCAGVEDDLDTCALSQSGWLAMLMSSEPSASCVVDVLRAKPQLVAGFRCEAQRLRTATICDLTSCPMLPSGCEGEHCPLVQEDFTECFALHCASQDFVRCNGEVECPDGRDERDC